MEKCGECQCKVCMLSMPQGDSSDCHNCDLCIEGDMMETGCEGFKPWGDKPWGVE